MTTCQVGKPEKPFLSKGEIADLTGFSLGTIDGEIAAGRLEALKFTRRVLIERSAFESWLGAAKARATRACA